MIYLDTSVIVALFLDDAFSSRADAALRGKNLKLAVSDFAIAEFASSVGRLVRMREVTAKEARSAFGDFDRWNAKFAVTANMQSADVATATAFLRRLDLNLRAPDAINIAIAQRSGAELATFDARMAGSAKTLGVPLAAL